MDYDYRNICTTAASQAAMPPVTFESLTETMREAQRLFGSMRAKAKANEFVLRVECGLDCVLPSERWPIGGIAINTQSHDGLRLLQALKELE